VYFYDMWRMLCAVYEKSILAITWTRSTRENITFRYRKITVKSWWFENDRTRHNNMHYPPVQTTHTYTHTHTHIWHTSVLYAYIFNNITMRTKNKMTLYLIEKNKHTQIPTLYTIVGSLRKYAKIIIYL